MTPLVLSGYTAAEIKKYTLVSVKMHFISQHKLVYIQNIRTVNVKKKVGTTVFKSVR